MTGRAYAADAPDWADYEKRRKMVAHFRAQTCPRRSDPSIQVSECWCWHAGPNGETLRCPPLPGTNQGDPGDEQPAAEPGYGDYCGGYNPPILDYIDCGPAGVLRFIADATSDLGQYKASQCDALLAASLALDGPRASEKWDWFNPPRVRDPLSRIS